MCGSSVLGFGQDHSSKDCDMALALIIRVGIGVCEFGSFRSHVVDDPRPLAYDAPPREKFDPDILKERAAFIFKGQ
jgi:hypothetical protein